MGKLQPDLTALGAFNASLTLGNGTSTMKVENRSVTFTGFDRYANCQLYRYTEREVALTTIVLSVVVGVLALAFGALIGQALRSKKDEGALQSAAADAERIIAEAQTKEKELLLEAKEE